MTTVYVLWHCPGFQDYPDGFEIADATLDRTSLLEGFVMVYPGEY
jgi:hypothetical protein